MVTFGYVTREELLEDLLLVLTFLFPFRTHPTNEQSERCHMASEIQTRGTVLPTALLEKKKTA